MPFENGSISFRMFLGNQSLPEDAHEKFLANQAPSLDLTADTVATGWVTGRHLLDRQIDEETAFYGGYFRMALLQSQRRIPTSLLKAEMQLEELVHMATTGNEYVSRRDRSEIKRGVTDRLLPQMPPTLKHTPVVHEPNSNMLYASALSEKQCDEFNAFWRHTLGYSLIPLTPETVAKERHKAETAQWYPVSFSPDVSEDLVDDVIGRDFLTWLMFYGEEKGGMINVPKVGDVGILIEGPLVFTMEGSGAHVTALRKGNPVQSAEATTCLASGKKLSKAKLTLVIHDQVWDCTLDDQFCIRSLKLPEGEEDLDNLSRFMDRMKNVGVFCEMLLGCYDEFVKVRSNRDEWKKSVEPEIHKWVKNRKSVR